MFEILYLVRAPSNQAGVKEESQNARPTPGSEKPDLVPVSIIEAFIVLASHILSISV